MTSTATLRAFALAAASLLSACDASETGECYDCGECGLQGGPNPEDALSASVGALGGLPTVQVTHVREGQCGADRASWVRLQLDGTDVTVVDVSVPANLSAELISTDDGVAVYEAPGGAQVTIHRSSAEIAVSFALDGASGSVVCRIDGDATICS